MNGCVRRLSSVEKFLCEDRVFLVLAPATLLRPVIYAGSAMNLFQSLYQHVVMQ